MSNLDIFRDEFIPNIQSFNKLSYSTWRAANPVEAQKWEVYRDALLAGQAPIPPVLTTKYGKALVAGGKMALIEAQENQSELLCLPRAGKDFGVPTSGDAQPRFLSMLSQLNDGDAVAVEPGLYTFYNPVRMPKSSQRIVGLGGQDKWFSDGVRIQPGRDNMTVFEDGFSSNVKHGGCTWEWINLGSQRSGTRGWHFKNVNHWKLIRCSTAHRMDRDGIFVDIPSSEIPAGDNAYVEIISHAARQSSGHSLNVYEGGTMRVEGGYFDAPKGIYIRQSGQVIMRDGKSNHEGRLLLIEGQLNIIENWGFEQYNSQGNPVYAVEILKNGSLPVPWSGNENRIEGCMFVDHPHATGKMLHLGPGTRNNIVDSFWQGGASDYYWDEGSANENRNPK